MPIFITLQIVNLSRKIAVINKTKATILIIATIKTTIAASHGKKRVIFLAKKIVTLISIQTMSKKRQKKFENKTKNFVEIKANTIHFWQIMKEI